jgi:integrase
MRTERQRAGVGPADVALDLPAAQPADQWVQLKVGLLTDTRAFTVPLAEFVLELLCRRRAENRLLFPGGDGGWVFPTRDRLSRIVHVNEARVMRSKNGKRIKATLPSPHRLRDTFASAARSSGWRGSCWRRRAWRRWRRIARWARARSNAVAVRLPVARPARSGAT